MAIPSRVGILGANEHKISHRFSPVTTIDI